MTSKLIENIIKYYVEELVEQYGCSETEALNRFEDALQSSRIETEIFDHISDCGYED